VLADVDYDTALLDPKLAEAACDAKTTCVLPVHLYGQLADMRAFRALADKRGCKRTRRSATDTRAARSATRRRSRSM
jgi:hypothetical protein